MLGSFKLGPTGSRYVARCRRLEAEGEQADAGGEEEPGYWFGTREVGCWNCQSEHVDKRTRVALKTAKDRIRAAGRVALRRLEVVKNRGIGGARISEERPGGTTVTGAIGLKPVTWNAWPVGLRSRP